MNNMRLLITGICGFIGHHVAEHFLKNTNWEIIGIDKLTYAASGFDRLRDISVFDDKRVTIYTADIIQPISEGIRKEIGPVDYILHLAAETHVDNSIVNPQPFVMTNVLGTYNLLEYAKTIKNLRAFNYFSTDEVFGPAPEGKEYQEWDRYKSGNPYAATKAGGEELALAYANTYGLPVFITHTMNAFGERQHPEKFIPKVIRAVLSGETVPIHASKDKTKAGSRFWIHGRNIAQALHFLLMNLRGSEIQNQYPWGEKFNIVGDEEVDNLTMAQKIAQIVGKELKYEMVDFHSSRPGHDLRYALDGRKLAEMGFYYPKTFNQSLAKTIEWYLEKENERWLNLV